MKKYQIILAVILAAALTGCAKEENIGNSGGSSTGTSSESSVQNSSSTDNDGISSVSSTGSSDVSDNSNGFDSSDSTRNEDSAQPSGENGDPNATFLIGLDGSAILRSELSMIFTNDGTDGSAETFSEENFSGVLCDGFVYLAEPSGICRTSFDNEDVFDSEQMRFTDISESSKKDYKRVSVGETFCGLMLTEAQVNFARGNDSMEYTLGDGSIKLGSELGIPEIYFMGGSAKFSGQVALTGYISVATENDHGLAGGDIIFVPSGCECMLPVMGYRFDPDIGIVHMQRINSHNGLVWENEYGSIFLGNAADTTADLSDIPDDGSFVKASVTLDNISLTCGIGMMERFTADIADIEVFSAE